MVRRIGVVFVSRMDNMKTVVIVWLARVVLVLLDRTGDVKREVFIIGFLRRKRMLKLSKSNGGSWSHVADARHMLAR